MMNLHKDTNAFKELIALSADYFGYEHVEPYSSAADAIIFKEPDSIMALPEIKSAYVTDLSKLLFGRSKRPDVSAAVNVLTVLHQRLSTISPSKPRYV